MKILPSAREKKLVIEQRRRYVSISSYGKIVVRETEEFGAAVRLLLVNGTRESATFMTPGLRNEPVFEYLRAIAQILEKRPQPIDALLIGGAGYSFPKYFISHFLEGRLDVVENNPEMPEIARKYFYLDELYEAYGLAESGRLQTHIDDGLRYLQNCEKKYDLILNDAFIGRVADKDLSGEAGCLQIRAHLKPDGLYLVNAITARTGQGAMPGVMAQEVMSRVFRQVRMIPVRPDYPADQSQNVILYATMGET